MPKSWSLRASMPMRTVRMISRGQGRQGGQGRTEDYAVSVPSLPSPPTLPLLPLVVPARVVETMFRAQAPERAGVHGRLSRGFGGGRHHRADLVGSPFDLSERVGARGQGLVQRTPRVV